MHEELNAMFEEIKKVMDERDRLTAEKIKLLSGKFAEEVKLESEKATDKFVPKFRKPSQAFGCVFIDDPDAFLNTHFGRQFPLPRLEGGIVIDGHTVILKFAAGVKCDMATAFLIAGKLASDPPGEVQRVWPVSTIEVSSGDILQTTYIKRVVTGEWQEFTPVGEVRLHRKESEK